MKQRARSSSLSASMGITGTPTLETPGVWEDSEHANICMREDDKNVRFK